MAATHLKPTWKVNNYKGKYNASASVAIDPYLCLVPDSTADRAAKVPATSSTPASFAGVSRLKIAAASFGDVAATPGDVAVVKASGAIVKGDRITIDTASTKEGFGKAFTSGTNVLVVGVALTAADDGELFEMEIQPMQIDA
jgi:hypothetical protein